MDNVEQAIKEYIAQEFLGDRPHIVLESNLVEEGVVDSLGIMALISFIDEQFGAKIKPEDVVVENFQSVAAIARLVRLRIVAKVGP